MTQNQYDEYKKVESFKHKCMETKKYIREIDNQVFGGDSRVGYMIEEVQQMKKELIAICDKNIEKAEELKSKI